MKPTLIELQDPSRFVHNTLGTDPSITHKVFDILLGLPAYASYLY